MEKSSDYLKIDPIPILQGELLEEFDGYLNLHSRIQNLFQQLSQDNCIDVLEKSLPPAKEIISLLESVNGFPIKNAISLSDIKKKTDIAEEVLEKISKVSPLISSLCEKIGDNSSKAFNVSENGLKEFVNFIDLVCDLDSSLWNKRNSCFEMHEIDDVITPLHSQIQLIKEKKDKLQLYFELSNLPKYSEIEFIKNIISVNWIFGIFKKKWWQSRKNLRLLSKNPKEKFSVLKDNISMLCSYAHDCEELENHSENKRILLNLYNGANTDVASLVQLRDWYKKIKKTYGLSVSNSNNIFLKDLILSISPEIAVDIQSLKNNEVYDYLQSTIDSILEIKSIFNENKIKKQDFIVDEDSSFLSRWY